MPLRTRMAMEPTLNLTSMIDVVFLLLIFFMVGAKFTAIDHRIDIKVPEVADQGTLTPAPERRRIEVAPDGIVYLDGGAVTVEELTARLRAVRQEYREIGVLVRADSESRYQRVAEVLNSCRLAGIHDMSISVHPRTTRR